VARVEPTEDSTAPPHVDEGREVSPPWPVEAAKTPALVAEPVLAEAVAGEEETSPPGPVTVEVEDVETRALDEPAAAMQRLAVPESMAGAITPEIQVAEETGRPFPKVWRAAMPGRLCSRVHRGRLPPGLTLTLRTTRRSRCATPWRVG
jgi:hypothetical protein